MRLAGGGGGVLLTGSEGCSYAYSRTGSCFGEGKFGFDFSSTLGGGLMSGGCLRGYSFTSGSVARGWGGGGVIFAGGGGVIFAGGGGGRVLGVSCSISEADSCLWTEGGGGGCL